MNKSHYFFLIPNDKYKVMLIKKALDSLIILTVIGYHASDRKKCKDITQFQEMKNNYPILKICIILSNIHLRNEEHI